MLRDLLSRPEEGWSGLFVMSQTMTHLFGSTATPAVSETQLRGFLARCSPGLFCTRTVDNRDIDNHPLDVCWKSPCAYGLHAIASDTFVHQLPLPDPLPS